MTWFPAPPPAHCPLCADCGCRLLPGSGYVRCAECRLVRRNQQLDTRALRKRRQQLLHEARRAVIQERLHELDDERGSST